MVGKIEINTTCNRFSNLKVLDITITTETLLINNIAELVIITEVKFIKKFLHAVGENCHGNKKVYIVNHKGNVHGKQSLMIIISSFSACIPLLSQFRKSVGPCLALYKYNRDVVITLYCMVKNDCFLSIKNDHFLYFLTIKQYGLKNEAFSTRRLCEWRRRKNR